MKKLNFTLLLLWISLSTFGQAVESKYNSKNYNSWSVGVNLGNTYVTAEATSFESPEAGFEIGFGANVVKQITSALGLKAQIGAGNLSGSSKEVEVTFESKYKSLAVYTQFNLSNLTLTGRKVDRGVGIYLDLGAGALAFVSTPYVYGSNKSIVLNEPFSHQTGSPKGEDTVEWMFCASLSGKFRLTDKVSLDLGVQGNLLQGSAANYLDAIYESRFSSNNDAYFYSYMGFSVNLGNKRRSLEWTNPLDDMSLEVSKISEKIEGMTNDMDNDGVVDSFDEDNYTPEGVFVDTKGRARDIDGDGVPDHLDMDPFTRKGAEVDENGREIDSDGDGVPDSQDLEANTAPGALVNFQGKSIAVAMGGGISGGGGVGGNAYLPSIYFETGKHFVTYANYERIASIAKVLKSNPNIKMRVIGHTDQNGTEEANITLGEKRAQAVVDHLIDIYGVDPTQIFSESKGEFELISNKVDEVNRRVDFVLIPPQ